MRKTHNSMYGMWRRHREWLTTCFLTDAANQRHQLWLKHLASHWHTQWSSKSWVKISTHKLCIEFSQKWRKHVWLRRLRLWLLKLPQSFPTMTKHEHLWPRRPACNSKRSARASPQQQSANICDSEDLLVIRKEAREPHHSKNSHQTYTFVTLQSHKINAFN